MKHRPRPLEQDDLLRPRLVDLIDLRHELVKLAALIDWEVFERQWSGFFPSHKGRPTTEPRLAAGLLYLQHAYRLSNEGVVARWVEKSSYQHFTGETFFQHRLPVDPSSPTRWCKRIGIARPASSSPTRSAQSVLPSGSEMFSNTRRITYKVEIRVRFKTIGGFSCRCEVACDTSNVGDGHPSPARQAIAQQSAERGDPEFRRSGPQARPATRSCR